MRCTISIIYLQNPQWTEILQKLFPDTVFGVWAERSPSPQCSILASEGTPSLRFAATSWPNLEYVFTSKKYNTLPPALRGWHCSILHIPHSTVGGVSSGAWHVFGYRSPPWLLKPMISYPGPDLRTIVDHLNSGGRSVPAPTTCASSCASVIRARPNTFHITGLFPHGVLRPYFIVPCVYRNPDWVCRRLSALEFLKVYDFTPSVLALIPTKHLANLCSMEFLPLKVLFAALSRWLSPEGGEGILVDVSRKNRDELSHTDVDSHQGRSAVISSAPTVSKVAKNDDAEAPVALWNDPLFSIRPAVCILKQTRAGDSLRVLAMHWWRKHLRREFFIWFKGAHPPFDTTRPWAKFNDQSAKWEWADPTTLKGYKSWFKKLQGEAKMDWCAGSDAVRRGLRSSWWEWDAGSRAFHWRWPIYYRKTIRDGVPPRFYEQPKRWRVPQPPVHDLSTIAAIVAKILKVILKGYLEEGRVESLTRFFAVPKGDSDIRMVYDGTLSGLNTVTYSPWFPLPTVETLLRSVEPGTFLGDNDVGDMFLNFVMHEDMKPYCGVDVSALFPLPEGKRCHWLRWGRCGMGFTPSPYNSVQGMLIGEEVVLGDKNEDSNIFAWDQVRMNLPGQIDYDPSAPWVSKVCQDGSLACDLSTYIDDGRTSGGTQDKCWKASKRTASVLNHLGLQDAPRKRRKPSVTAGPWQGSVVLTKNGFVGVSVTQERWDKFKELLSWVKLQVDERPQAIPHHTLECHRGFFIYLVRTYTTMVPYLKGIHLTLDSWRSNRDTDGWRMTAKEIKFAYAEKHASAPEIEKGAPASVAAVPRLRKDIEALLELSKSCEPPVRLVRARKSATAIFGFGDASGSGFGSSLIIAGRIHYRHGQWDDGISVRSSNFRELLNLVSVIEEAADDGLLDNTELFLFTDNTTAEGAYFKGSSKSKLIFDLVLRLKLVEQNKQLILHVIHVAGTRMIWQGTDGLSRGDLFEGVMSGESMHTFIPLHQPALTREPAIRLWINSWWGTATELLHLDPAGWYTTGQGVKDCLWDPAPAAVDAALEQLGKAKHKRPEICHVVVVPRLFTSRWRKQLRKIADVVFTVPVGVDFWPCCCHEPLIVAICLPLADRRPWRLRNTKLVGDLERSLSSLSQAAPAWGRDLLREFLHSARNLSSLPELLVREMLHTYGRGKISDSRS